MPANIKRWSSAEWDAGPMIAEAMTSIVPSPNHSAGTITLFTYVSESRNERFYLDAIANIFAGELMVLFWCLNWKAW